MRHNVDGRKFGRNTSHRVALFRNLANSVIKDEQVITTVQKAKEVRRVIDRLITLSKSSSPQAQRLAFDRTRNKEVVKKLFGDLKKRYGSRPGGYTRILKLSDLRKGDGAEMAMIELVDHPVLDRKKAPLAAASKAGAEAADQAGQSQPKDPFNRFRKLFTGTKKKSTQASKKKSD